MKGIMVSVRGNDIVLKEAALASIQNILVSQYKVSASLAATLIKRSKIDQIFDRNAEIAAHTSNKTWAQRAYGQLNVNDCAVEYTVRDVTQASNYLENQMPDYFV